MAQEYLLHALGIADISDYVAYSFAQRVMT